MDKISHTDQKVQIEFFLTEVSLNNPTNFGQLNQNPGGAGGIENKAKSAKLDQINLFELSLAINNYIILCTGKYNSSKRLDIVMFKSFNFPIFY